MRQSIHWNMKAEHPYALNLDEEFKPFSGVELLYKRFNFRGGEPHFQITNKCAYPEASSLVITQRYNKVEDLFSIILANDACKRMGFNDIHLILPYFPAARQDRVCNQGEPLTLKVFADMINACGFKSVTVFCPHSEVTPALINNVIIDDEIKYVEQALRIAQPKQNNATINIVCPDAGAGKRVNKIVTHLANKYTQNTINLIRCEKIRDVKDGSIKEFFVGADNLEGKTTLICDDINSMGGTFIGLAKELRNKNCGELMLFTAHSDCYEGIKNVSGHFDKVFTTNSKRNWTDSSFYKDFDKKVTCFKLNI